MNDFPFLEVLSGKEKAEKGNQYTLSYDTLHIGRAPDNDIILDDKRVSRHHAQISHEEGEYFIEDLNTSNGTFVNKSKILNQKLHYGDIIQIGSYTFSFSKASFTVPQRETIARTSPSKSPLRLMVYVSGGLFLLLIMMILVLPTKKPSKSKSISITSQETIPSKPSSDSSAIYSINWEKANQFYLSGYREFFSESYLRALDDFKTALELYPEHRLAQIYLKKTEDMITKKTNENYKSALNYFNGGQYQLAIYHFKQVMTLTKHRKPGEAYCAIRTERAPALENPDFEKYCESQEKIIEAQSRLSQEQGFK